jgi:hypothetical protein
MQKHSGFKLKGNIDGDGKEISNIKINILINEQIDNYTLILSDNGKLIDMNKGTEVTLTIPKNSSVTFPIGTSIAIRQKGIGKVTIAPVDGDVTINYTDGLKTTKPYAMASLLKVNTDIWTICGSLEV